MKKNLLAIGFLTITALLSAQKTVMYSGLGSKVYVSSGTLVYSGGNWVVDSNVANTVENSGNIMIVGDYKKGLSSSDAAADGKEFVNLYNSENDYGQVQILSSLNTTDALMTMQRPAAPSTYFDADFPISFPFKDNVKDIMRSFGKTIGDFKGDCGLNVNCGSNRYNMSLFKWNNDKIVGDAVPSADALQAGDYYFLNLRSGANLKLAMTGTIGYKGTPAPQEYSATGKSIIPGMSESDFSEAAYNDWKNKKNAYNELYQSYLGAYNSINKVTGKNVYRFGNPYTSNINISAVDGVNAWLKITNGGDKTIQQAYDATSPLIKNFNITKRTGTYDITWNASSGSTSTTTLLNNGYFTAEYNGTQWTGNPEALIIRPLETFNLLFKQIYPTALGSRIVGVKVAFNDSHKTFQHPKTAGPITPGARIAPNGKKNNEKSNSTSSNTYGFYQAEIFLLENGKIGGNPVYLVGTKYNTESAPTVNEVNNIFLYGMNDGLKVETSKKSFNDFNSETYIGKPMSLGFNKLVEGNSYELKFNLYENDIFNNVKSLSDGKFLIKDKLKNTETEILPTKTFSFLAEGDVNNRFDIYWKEITKVVLGTSNLVKNSETFIYKERLASKIKFEKLSKFANIEFYDMAGRLVSAEKNVSTASDYEIKLAITGVYIVKVTYNDGTVRNLKGIK